MTASPVRPPARAAEPEGGALIAALWLACYERLAAAAAHEVNNALNGVAMNLEVVRLRARPGGDAGAVAPFAAAGAEEHAATVAFVGALLALGRAPRGGGGTDVAAVLGHAVALFAAPFRHRGVAVHVTTPDHPARTAAPARAVRLAVCAALEAAGQDAAGPEADVTRGDARGHTGGAGGESARALRCNLEIADGPALVVAPGPAGWDAGLGAALAEAGVRVTWAPAALRIAFAPG